MLARLVEAPGTEVAASELAGRNDADAPPAPADLGPALDARAKRAYRRRMLELQEEVDEATANSDPERAAAATAEFDALVSELERAVGLSGRDRPQGSGSERDRVNVTRNLRRAIGAIEKIAPSLGAHLRIAIRTGHLCAYDPDPSARLRLGVDRSR